MAELPELRYRATLGACLQRAVTEYGDRDFIVMPERRSSFRDIEIGSRFLAKKMVAAGLGKGTRVGLFYTYGPEFCIAWLAALRIGCLVEPFSTLYKPAELRTALRIGDVQTLIAPDRLLGRDVGAFLEQSVPNLRDQSAPNLVIPELPYLRSIWITGETQRPWATRVAAAPDRSAELISDEMLSALETEVSPADLAQITFTSGSSAQPKAVVHTHGSIVRNSSSPATAATLRAVGIGIRLRRVFGGFPFFWIGGTLVLGQALQEGWTVCCLERFDAGAALDLIENERVDWIMAWPSLIQAMRADPSFPSRDLRLPQLAAPVAAPGGSGPTRHRGMSETMGAWFGVDCKIVDPATGATLPAGADGELCVRGHAVMQGYYKVEREATFDADGWLHTGDSAVLSDSGPLFTGRYTEMIKHNGANVSPREVEVALESLPGVQHAIVFGLPHPELGEQVTAVVVPEPGRNLSAGGLQEQARDQLSSFKVPTRIEFVADASDIPWLATGKPDKLRLRTALA